jgi:arylsulfatase
MVFIFSVFPVKYEKTHISEKKSEESNGNSETGKPNILLIVADDMGYSKIGPFGSEIKTPVLDWKNRKR